MENDMSESFRLQLNELRHSLVPDIVALELYNHKKSRLRCSIAWLLSKVFDGHVPLEYEDPLIDEQYTDEETSKQLELNPSVAALLTSGRAYADAARMILRQQPSVNGASLHAGVLVLLQQSGFYTLSEEPSGKNNLSRIESQLSLNNPIRASVHQTVIDAFMRAYLVNNFSADRVTSAIRSIAHLSPVEQPRSTEEALLLWISKVCHVVRARLEAERRERAAQLTRQNGRSTVRLEEAAQPVIPIVKDLLADISDGAALATLICHYCPDHLRISDVALKDPLGVADSCFNLEIVRLFSDHLDKAIYFFRLEDLLYMHSSFKPNVIVFLADLFACLCSTPPLLCACSRPIPGSNNNENIMMKSSNDQNNNNNNNARGSYNNEPYNNTNGHNHHRNGNGNGNSLLSEVEFSSDFGDTPAATNWPTVTKSTVVVVADDDIPSGRKQLFVKRHHCHHHYRKLHRYYGNMMTLNERPCSCCISNNNDNEILGDYYCGHAWRRPGRRIGLSRSYRHLTLRPQSPVVFATPTGYQTGLLAIVPPSIDTDDTGSMLSGQGGGYVVMAPASSSPPVLSLRQSSGGTTRTSGAGSSSGGTLTQPSRPLTASSYTVVSSTRQFANAESALEAGIPVVATSNGGSVSSPRSVSDNDTGSSVAANRITWAQLQQQQQQERQRHLLQQQQQQQQRPSSEDDEVEAIVQASSKQHPTQGPSLGLQARSASVGSLSLKLQLERRKREQEQLQQQLQQQQQQLQQAGSVQYGTRRSSAQSSTPSGSGTNGTWNPRSPRLSNGNGVANEGYNQRLEQLNQSLSDLHMQLSQLSSPPKQKPQPQQPPPPQVLTVPQPAPVVIYQTTPLPVQVAIPGAYYPQMVVQQSQFQSTPSLLMPGPLSGSRSSAFHPQQPEPTTPTSTSGHQQQQQAFFVPIPTSQHQTQANSSNGAPSVDSTSSSNKHQQYNDFTINEDALAEISQVRRSQSLSALANRLAVAGDGSSTSLGLLLGIGDKNSTAVVVNQDETSSVMDKSDTTNIAFVVGDMVDADELERRRRQKCVEMELKRKLESSGKKDVGKRDVEAARLREEIRQRQEEQERRRTEHRLKQKQVFEEWQQKKKQDEEALEFSRIGEVVRPKTVSTTMPKSKSRDALSMSARPTTKPRRMLGTVQSEHENLAALATNGNKSAPPPRPPGSFSSRNTSIADFGDAASESGASADVMSITVTPSVPLRVQPSAKSNKTLVYNAIRDTCLAGGANAKQRQEALLELDKAPSHIRHFIILFRDAGCQYRGLYTFEPDASIIERIHGIGPKTIKNAMIEHFFKYNSGSKRFSSIPTTQHLSVSVDAVSVYQQFWQQRVASANTTPATATGSNNNTMSRSGVVSVPNSVLAVASQTTPTKRGAPSTTTTNNTG